MQLTDGVSTVFRGFNINVFALTFTSNLQLPNATQYSNYSTTITASGGTGSYTFSLGGGLPNGLTFSNGSISGTVNTGPGRYAFNVTVTDTSNNSYTRTMSIDVVGTPPQLPAMYVENLLQNLASLGVNYSDIVSVGSGGTAPFTWSASGLPPGMALRTYQYTQADYMAPGDAELWGTPTQSGPFNVTFTVTDATGASATQTIPFVVSNLMVDGNDRLPNGTVGVVYSKMLRVLGGTAPYTVSQIGAFFQPLPDGISLNTSTFLVSGTPVEDGGFSPVIKFQDSAMNSFVTTNYLSISGGPSTLTINNGYQLGTITVGGFYSNQLQACCAAGYTWSLAGGTLPPGLTISPSGNLSGTVTTAGSYTFLIEVVDSTNSSNTAFRQFNMTVTPVNASVNGVLPDGNVGTFYSQPLGGSGGSGTLTWAVTQFNNPLPPGLTFRGARFPVPRPFPACSSLLLPSPMAAGTFSSNILIFRFTPLA